VVKLQKRIQPIVMIHVK